MNSSSSSSSSSSSLPQNKKQKNVHDPQNPPATTTPTTTPTTTTLRRFYRTPAFSAHGTNVLRNYLVEKTRPLEIQVLELSTEYCFYVETKENLTQKDLEKLHWLLSETYEPQQTKENQSFLLLSQEKDNHHHHQTTTATSTSKQWLIEIGPRMNFSTAWSSNAVAICQACGLEAIKRIEKATRYLIQYEHNTKVTSKKAEEILQETLLAHEYDRMTQEIYSKPLTSFWHGKQVEPVRTIPIMKEGMKALKQINEEIGLGFDEWDLEYYFKLFKEKLQRDPTDVECFDLGQSNSEHSRHWFFGGKLIIDGKEKPFTLFQMVKSTLTKEAKQNSIIAFHDNSSVIQGKEIQTLEPLNPGNPSKLGITCLTSHLLLTAETHNFPCGIAPFPGAETGTGGRIRDVQATGRGAHVIAGISAYCVGNLLLDGYFLPWENKTFSYPSNIACPSEILLQASNGASDY
jgi:phosphoribosylformylglycinamidine synthase